MTELVDSALGYAARGWPVLPLRPRRKEPATSHGLHDATVDVDRIVAWWERCPDYNIGLRTGDRFDVLDCDGPGALDELDRAGAEATGCVECGTISGPIVITGNGVHIYTQPTGRRNTAAIRPGIDWRGEGGYVVAAGSTHPNGTVYEWAAANGPDTPLEPAPAWLLAAWDNRQAPATPGRSAPTTNGQGTAYGIRALQSELGCLIMVGVGSRNDELVRSAYRLGRLVAGGQLDARHVVLSLISVADRLGLPEGESMATIRSGLKAGSRNPRRPEKSR